VKEIFPLISLSRDARPRQSNEGGGVSERALHSGGSANTISICGYSLGKRKGFPLKGEVPKLFSGKISAVKGEGLNQNAEQGKGKGRRGTSISKRGGGLYSFFVEPCRRGRLAARPIMEKV